MTFSSHRAQPGTLLDHPELEAHLGRYDPELLTYTWSAADLSSREPGVPPWSLSAQSVRCWILVLFEGRAMSRAPAGAEFRRDPLALIAVSAAPVALEGRYRLLVGAFWRLRHSRRGRWMIAAVSGVFAIVVALLAAGHFATAPFPLSGGHPGWLVTAGLLLLLAQALKAFGWARLFAPKERPPALALAAGNGGAAVIGVVLPGRFDDAMRIAVVRRFRGCPASVRARPLLGHARPDRQCRAGAARGRCRRLSRLGDRRARRAVVVTVAGVAAAALIVALPRLAASRRALRFRLGRWLSPRTTSLRGASQAWAFVSACWLVRAVALFMLLGTLGVGFSFPLALLFLCAGAAAAALPIGPAGAAAQAGASGAALIGSGVGSSQAIGVAVSVAALGVFSGAAVLLFAVACRAGLRLLPIRSAA
jgi:hypothetical protein